MVRWFVITRYGEDGHTNSRPDSRGIKTRRIKKKKVQI